MMVLSDYLPGRDRHRDPCYGHATYGRQRFVVWTVNCAFEEALLTSRPLFPIVPLEGMMGPFKIPLLLAYRTAL